MKNIMDITLVTSFFETQSIIKIFQTLKNLTVIICINIFQMSVQWYYWEIDVSNDDVSGVY